VREISFGSVARVFLRGDTDAMTSIHTSLQRVNVVFSILSLELLSSDQVIKKEYLCSLLSVPITISSNSF